jgi:hypothetical protein
MKLILTFFISAFMFTSNKGCREQNKTSNCLKGQLVIKGICINYTIKLLEGNIDSSLIESQWMDDHANKSYTNVFALGSRCNFPENIKEGDSFYFTIDNSPVQNCNVCMAYYPTPSKKLNIRVLNTCK